MTWPYEDADWITHPQEEIMTVNPNPEPEIIDLDQAPIENLLQHLEGLRQRQAELDAADRDASRAARMGRSEIDTLERKIADRLPRGVREAVKHRGY